MQEIIYTKGYETLRAELKEELSKSVESFVRIGYLLKVARDTNILSESPYSNMEEFAYAEFKIDKGTASKFIGINDRFSEDGYSDRLKSEYVGIGWSKLAIMLQLPDSINEELSPEFSKSEIQTIRDEIAEEQQTTPLEHMMQGETATTEKVEDMLDKAVRQLGESEPDLYVEIHTSISKSEDLSQFKMIMAPSGEQIYSIRIRGIGRIMLSLKQQGEGVAMINERTGAKEMRRWEDIYEAWLRIIDTNRSAEDNWSEVYEQSFPKKAEVAPVQQNPASKKETKKVVKVNEKKKESSKTQKSVSKTLENVTESAEIVPKTEENVSKSLESVMNPPENVSEMVLHDIDEQIPLPEPAENLESTECEDGSATVVDDNAQVPGQTDIEKDFPQYMPNKEDKGKIWDRASVSVAKLNLFFQDWSAKELEKAQIPKENLLAAHNNALNLAADLERIING